MEELSLQNLTGMKELHILSNHYVKHLLDFSHTKLPESFGFNQMQESVQKSIAKSNKEQQKEKDLFYIVDIDKWLKDNKQDIEEHQSINNIKENKSYFFVEVELQLVDT